MSNNKSEFGRDFELGFSLHDYPRLIDKSWHNDVCPSFYYKTARGYLMGILCRAGEARRRCGTLCNNKGHK